MPDPGQGAGFGLYVHWPFCQAKCPYCDFNSHVSRSIDQAQWAAAYVAEIQRWAAETGRKPLSSVYFGGGTPSLMPADTVGRILHAAHMSWGFANDIEITLEANPGSVDAGRFQDYAAAGVNRVSLGVQALEDEDLHRLGRIHTVQDALAGLDIAQNCFDRVSFDLICARQHQGLKDWEVELKRALSLQSGHLSLYQLTIEPGTVFGERLQRGRLQGLPDEDMAAEFYNLTQAMCADAGLPAYEISNHARPGQESRHNLIYWNGGEYVGIGPGAHGRVSLGKERVATSAVAAPSLWIEQAGTRAVEERSPLSAREQAEEYVMMGLRTSYGLDIKRYSEISGAAFDPVKQTYLEEIGMLTVSPERIRATPRGRLVLNAVIAELLSA